MSICLAAQSTETVASRTGPWIAALLFIALGTFIIVANWSCVWANYRRGRSSSTIPFLGGGFAATGLLLLPASGAHTWWWIAPLIDVGCWTGVLGLPLLIAGLLAWPFHRPPMSYSTVTTVLKRHGWFFDGGDGRVLQYRHKRKRGTVTIVQAGHLIRAIPPGARRSILRQAGLDKSKQGA